MSVGAGPGAPPDPGGGAPQSTSGQVLWVVLPGVVGIIGVVLAFAATPFSAPVKLLSGVVIAATAAAAAIGGGQSRRSSPPSTVSTAATYVLAGVAVAGITLLVVFGLTGRPTALAVAQPLQGAFTDPQDGQDVTSPVPVRGSARLTTGATLWILVQPPDGRFYATTATPVPVRPDGSWSLQGIGVGANEGGKVRTYWLYLVAFEDAASVMTTAPPGGGWVSFDALPSTAEQLDAVYVETGP